MDMEQQIETNWCWAAVAVSIHNFLHPNQPVTQGDVATQVLMKEQKIQQGVSCALTPAACNDTANLDDALNITGDLRPDGYKPNSYLDFSSIKAWVTANLPVGVRIVWQGGNGAHFIVLDGYREFQDGKQQVHVEDPDGPPSYQYYDDLVSDYPPGGNWQDSYLVQRSAAASPGSPT